MKILDLFKKQPSQAELIKMCHNDFYTACNIILEEANSILEESHLEELKKKQSRLSQLGFKSPDVDSEISRLRHEISENKKKKEEASLIFKYQTKYPNYKYINSEQVEKLCNKYGLVTGRPIRFKGDIPEKNLCEIEEALRIINREDCLTYRAYDKKQRSMGYLSESTVIAMDLLRRQYSEGIKNEPGLVVVAPVEQFDTYGYRIVGGKLLKDDPVILLPVIRYGDPCTSAFINDFSIRNNIGFLIISAWGPEASDPLVVNHKMN